MKSKGKCITSTLLLMVFVVSMLVGSLPAYAADTENRVFSETITAEQGKRISVPIKIENNTGFMGFVIMVEVDRDVLKPVNAKKGELLTGAFEDSIDVTTSGAFRVIYSGTENVDSDGTLFVLQFDVAAEALGDTTIALSYSKTDTFNEKYKEVVLNCEDVSVTVGESTTEPITDPPVDPPVASKLSERILNWWNNLPKIWHYITSVVVVPLTFVLSKLGK